MIICMYSTTLFGREGRYKTPTGILGSVIQQQKRVYLLHPHFCSGTMGVLDGFFHFLQLSFKKRLMSDDFILATAFGPQKL